MAAHAVVVPYPGRGHVNLMMQFALKFASHGIPITFVVTKSWHKILTQADQNPFIHAPNLQVAVIPDCVVGESERWANMEAFFQSLSNMEAHMAQLLTNLSLSETPATCIVADVFSQVGRSFCQNTGSPISFAVSNVCHKFFCLLSFRLGASRVEGFYCPVPSATTDGPSSRFYASFSSG
ncbi:UDP-glycosyltransferase 86A1-like [Cryptomeria japonica]|uniref:UDP-glycosyltransferase 86A1-like n=1 Tax=Cryptomeria japonica TaxID=3369 RepID=UPI0027D9D249|nr:UDP-glycosyltransferase 86A1-like [Cryptomeria japonica]